LALPEKWTEQFEDFGEDPYLPYRRLPLNRTRSVLELGFQERLVALKREVMAHVEREPGVYGMLDDIGRLIYVGKSKALKNRLVSYFLPNSQDEKAGRIVQSAAAIVWEYHPNELSALLREQWLIRTWLPRMNVVGMPNRQQQAFLCLGKGPGEQFYVSRYHDSDARCSVGPLSGVNAIFRAVEILTRFFKLRDCSQKTPMFLTEQLSLFDMEERAGCIRYELNNCLGPCMTNCNRSEYQSHVSKAAKYLMDGEIDIATGIETEMIRASQRCHYEYAMRLKEDLRIVRWLTKKLQQYRKSRDDGPTIYCLSVRSLGNESNRPVWYFLRQGGVISVTHEPRNQKEWQTLKPVLDAWRATEKMIGVSSLDPEDTLGLMTAWLQKNAKSLISNTDEGSYQWVVKSTDLPESWRDVKEVLAQKRSVATTHPDRVAQL
jgi:excinuclease ABC subunit C